jgi:periplasmic protein TonB
MAARAPAWFESGGWQFGRWSIAAAVAVCAHAVLIGSYLLWSSVDRIDLGDDTATVAIELTAPDIDREAQPKVEAPPVPPQQSTPDAALPEEKPAFEPPTPETRTTRHAEAAAPPIDPTWRTQLVEQLQHFKNYPRAARARGEQGVVDLSFSVDRDGHVLSRRIVSSSGHPELDAEALAVVDRAQPLPAFPASMIQARLEVSWSVRFSLR